MKLLWKLKLDNEPRQMHSLFPPLIIEQRQHPQRPEADRHRRRRLRQHLRHRRRNGRSCSGRSISTAPGRRRPTAAAAAAFSAPADITATPVIAPTGTPGKYTIYAASWDGMLHQLNAADGEDVAPPAKWMPPNGKPYALNLFEQRDLHPHRAGLRRQSQRGLRLRPRHQ